MELKKLAELAEDLFSKRISYMSLLQEIAENFYPERADFTYRRDVGDEWSSNLSTSYPSLIRRELGDMLGVMLRDPQRPWFHMEPEDQRLKKNHEIRQRIEFQEQVMRRAMYDKMSLFTTAMKQGDHDFSSFGAAPLSVELNQNRDGLLYRCWHIRDMVWMEDAEGQLCFVARRWKCPAWDMVARFGSANVHKDVNEAYHKDPFREFELMHVVCDAEMADVKAGKMPRIQFTWDRDHAMTVQKSPLRGRHYVIPRWQTVSGSQYPYSPATITALPDARLIQAMSYTLLEAGEKATNPPMIATMDAVRSDVSIYAGGITWVDNEYDERLGAALRPITQDYKGLPFGMEMLQDTRGLLQEAFFINKLRAFNPTTDPEMTAFQAGQLVQQYIRGALPLFEPLEHSYNAAICEETFNLLIWNNGFGPLSEIPEALRGQEIMWRFESPLHDAIEAQKGQKFLEMKQLISEALALDEQVIALPDATTALRDALQGIQIPADWTRSQIEVDRIQQAREEAERNAQLQQQLAVTSDAAQKLAGAQADLQAGQSPMAQAA